MATKYLRLTYEDRCQIQAFLQVNMSVCLISQKLGFHKSTIYRELSRNKVRSGYEAKAANLKATKRFGNCRRSRRVTGDLEGIVLTKLFEDWSPEQIAARFERERERVVSHETIYRYVKRKKAGLVFCLRRYNKRGFARFTHGKRFVRGLSIKNRPAVANERKRIGDWERDCLFIANRKKILVCTDRKSRYTKIVKLHEATAKGVSEATEKLLRSTGKKVYSITNDNGSEFNGGPSMVTPFYYCAPLKPQQRGTVENTIGLIRQYLKRATDFYQLTDKDIKDVEDAINLRPRKCLDFKTPYEVFYGKSVALVY